MSLVARLLASSLDDLKSRTIAGDRPVYSFTARPDLDDHVEMLRAEFIGRTELELYHAVLTVLIRRRIELPAQLERFQALWTGETDLLCARLDSRWLVSACDTLMDHGTSDSERALAATASVLTNVIKLYETERWATGQSGAAAPYAPMPGRVALHDGLCGFGIGQGDLIANMHRRVHALCQARTPAACILLELLRRASEHDTVFRRFKDVHHHDLTRWW